jgi:hypothetical protein
MFEEPHDIATQCTASYEALMLRPAQGSSEVTLSSDKEATSNVSAHCTQEGIKGDKAWKMIHHTHNYERSAFFLLS